MTMVVGAENLARSKAPLPEARVRVAWKVKAMTAPGKPIATCVVQDVSAGGARLSVPPDTSLPDRFSLYLPLRDETHAVEVRWRREDACEVGVAFLNPGEVIAPDAPFQDDFRAEDDVREDPLRAHIKQLEEHIQKLDTRLSTLMERVTRLEFR